MSAVEKPTLDYETPKADLLRQPHRRVGIAVLVSVGAAAVWWRIAQEVAGHGALKGKPFKLTILCMASISSGLFAFDQIRRRYRDRQRTGFEVLLIVLLIGAVALLIHGAVALMLGI